MHDVCLYFSIEIVKSAKCTLNLTSKITGSPTNSNSIIATFLKLPASTIAPHSSFTSLYKLHNRTELKYENAFRGSNYESSVLINSIHFPCSCLYDCLSFLHLSSKSIPFAFTEAPFLEAQKDISAISEEG